MSVWPCVISAVLYVYVLYESAVHAPCFFSLHMSLYECVCIFTLGNPRASDHAPGGGTIGGGPHLHRRLPADLQDFPVKSHGGRQETARVVPYGKPPRHGKCVCVVSCCVCVIIRAACMCVL